MSGVYPQVVCPFCVLRNDGSCVTWGGDYTTPHITNTPWTASEDAAHDGRTHYPFVTVHATDWAFCAVEKIVRTGSSMG